MNSYYVLNNSEAAVACERMNNETVKKLWRGFSSKNRELNFCVSEEFIFKIGNTETPLPKDGKEFTLKVDKDGICIRGKDYGGLLRGFFALLMKFEYENGLIKIKHTAEESNYKLSNRMIHICVFPENSLYFIKKLIRLSALCQYTHIVIEFWGMLKYDCMNELSWENAFSKADAKELVKECNDLGIAPIPMFNHFGHASASRVCYGKHVVLDQNPELRELFTPDGWVWNIFSTEVFELLKKIRYELYDVFPDCRYIHIGFDEAYYVSTHDDWRKSFPKYLEAVTREVEKEGKRPMIWMDMLLEAGKFPACYTVGNADEVKILQNATSKSTIFVDWQYNCNTAPIPSLESLRDCGRDCMGAPWFDKNNCAAHIDTLTKNNMFGIMFTTWHTLKEHMPSILRCSKLMGGKGFAWSLDGDKNGGIDGGIREETATLLRAVSFEGNTYEDSGWSRLQTEV